MRKSTLILRALLYFFISIYPVYSFDGKDLVLIQGKVIDAENQNPVGLTIVFFNPNGKQVQAKSNSNDGSYQQVLQAGEKYNIVFKDYILIGEVPEIELPKSGKYNEIEKNFRVKKIATGLEICSFNPFKANQSDFANPSLSCLYELKTFLENNPKVSVIITIYINDSNPKPIEKKVSYLDSKNKTKTKKVIISTGEQLQELAENRVNTIKSYLKSLNIIERKVTFEIDSKTAAIPVKKTKSKKDKKSKEKIEVFSEPTVVVKVGKILNL